MAQATATLPLPVAEAVRKSVETYIKLSTRNCSCPTKKTSTPCQATSSIWKAPASAGIGTETVRPHHVPKRSAYDQSCHRYGGLSLRWHLLMRLSRTGADDEPDSAVLNQCSTTVETSACREVSTARKPELIPSLLPDLLIADMYMPDPDVWKSCGMFSSTFRHQSHTRQRPRGARLRETGQRGGSVGLHPQG